ncbi:MAG TPA: DUF1836 domain-containing protein [Firmicutes bacterium]|nr:DUF1836 domain-containing protein [Bacillota bacterium]
MNEKYLPGTVIEDSDENGIAFSMFEKMAAVTGGLNLSQICSITGLEPSTIQNWVKRGWVSRPNGKKYNAVQLARILIINMLRNTMQLEKIALLLEYVNGKVDDLSDDIIDETELYNLLCASLQALRQCHGISAQIIQKVTEEQLQKYQEPFPGAAVRLRKALVIMMLAYASGLIRLQAEELLSGLLA